MCFSGTWCSVAWKTSDELPRGPGRSECGGAGALAAEAGARAVCALAPGAGVAALVELVALVALPFWLGVLAIFFFFEELKKGKKKKKSDEAGLKGGCYGENAVTAGFEQFGNTMLMFFVVWFVFFVVFYFFLFFFLFFFFLALRRECGCRTLPCRGVDTAPGAGWSFFFFYPRDLAT
jgi:hypothetical protein